MKRLLLVAILSLWDSCSWAFTNGFIGAVCSGGVVACNLSTPFQTQDTSTLGYAVGSTDSFYYVGMVNTRTTPLVICGFNPYVRENGSLAGKTVYVERWSMSGNDLNTKIEDVATFDATISPNPIGYLPSIIAFGKTVSLEQNQALVVTFNETTGVTDNLTWAFQADTNPVTYQSFGSWSNLKVGTIDTNDDARVKLYGP